ncbi:MAG: transcriptional regulator [Actinobacteria bacterium]|jgi:transcriptional regulator with XRE-family HTH domain|nr:transcriptional regulator [Actinomycetota bacterium]NBY82645.1 transcriptional regulator [Actinomycetota bacterium]NCU96676.1 transcriptional regulator [Actinomycetota bacterium]NCZ77047.1 transcriptional regulator [Actinomycetota bacterium]
MNTNNPAQRLRDIRKSKGWSLQDVEHHSNGKWKAVVIGSYERGDRAISLKKAISLMQFYQVPITELFPDVTTQVSVRSISVNLNKLTNSSEVKSQVLQRFTKSIINRRRDWNGQILTIRANDLQFLALQVDKSESDTLDWLIESELIHL